MNLYCVVLDFGNEQAISHIAMGSDMEMEKYLDSQQQDFDDSGVIGWSFFQVSETDNGYKVSV